MPGHDQYPHVSHENERGRPHDFDTNPVAPRPGVRNTGGPSTIGRVELAGEQGSEPSHHGQPPAGRSFPGRDDVSGEAWTRACGTVTPEDLKSVRVVQVSRATRSACGCLADDDGDTFMTYSPMPSFSDLQLVDCVVLRDADAFNELFRRHAQSVASVARMVLGNSSASDDVVAEVFLGLWLKPHTFDATRASLVGFLRMKARGRSIDIVRADVARRRREMSDGVASRRGAIHPGENIQALGVSEQVRSVLATLIEREREPIELAFFAGMTYQEVALHLKLPEGTVKSRIRSGLQNARVNLGIDSLLEAKV